MKQYDVVVNPFRRQMRSAPFVLVLQHDRNDDSSAVIVAPLSIRGTPTRREVALKILGRDYVLLPLALTSVPRDAFEGVAIDNLAHESFRIQTALDIVFSAAG